jgi:hypothetical protein
MIAGRAGRAARLEIGNRTRLIGPVHYVDEAFVLEAGAERRVAQLRNDGTSY